MPIYRGVELPKGSRIITQPPSRYDGDNDIIVVAVSAKQQENMRLARSGKELDQIRHRLANAAKRTWEKKYNAKFGSWPIRVSNFLVVSDKYK